MEKLYRPVGDRFQDGNLTIEVKRDNLNFDGNCCIGCHYHPENGGCDLFRSGKRNLTGECYFRPDHENIHFERVDK